MIKMRQNAKIIDVAPVSEVSSQQEGSQQVLQQLSKFSKIEDLSSFKDRLQSR
jgi:hypothetical protein